MGFRLYSQSDADVYTDKDKNNNRDLYYKYFLVYFDDVLSIGEDTDYPIKIMEQFFRLKKGSLGWPDRYLVANVERIHTTDGRFIWSMNCQDYIKNTIEKVNKLSEEDENPIHKRGKVKRPMLKD